MRVPPRAAPLEGRLVLGRQVQVRVAQALDPTVEHPELEEKFPHRKDMYVEKTLFDFFNPGIFLAVADEDICYHYWRCSAAGIVQLLFLSPNRQAQCSITDSEYKKTLSFLTHHT